MSDDVKSKEQKNGGSGNSTSKTIIAVVIICVIICAIVIGIVGVKSGWFKTSELPDSSDTAIKNEIGNNSTIEKNSLNETASNTENNKKNETANNVVNETNTNSNETPTNTEKNQSSSESNIKKIEISDENILNILMDTDNFIDGANLSTDEYLSIVYNALNEGYIVLDEERSNQSGKSSVTYSVDEINSIVYSIFGVKLKDNMSLGDVLVYKNGKYTMQFSDRGAVVPVAKNVQYDAAAGTQYITYELYYEENGSEDLKGTYTIGISGQTGFVRSKKSM